MFKKKKPKNHLEEGIELIEEGVKIVKKKISLFYKLHFSIALIPSFILFYFLVLVPMQPKSIQYITNKTQEYLRKNFDDSAIIENSFISFTRYGSLKIEIKNIQFNKIGSAIEGNKLLLPKIESEFSLFDLIIFNFIPNKIKISDPKIIFLNTQTQDQNLNENQRENFLLYFSSLSEIFSNIKKNKIFIENIEIENAKFIIKKSDRINPEILIKSSQIKLLMEKNNLRIISSNLLNLNNSDKDISLNNNCSFSKNDFINCGLIVNNFSVNSLGNFCESCLMLNNIDATIDISSDFSIKEKHLQNLNFKASSAKGWFDLKDFFANKIYFENLTALGNYDRNEDKLNITEIKANLKSDENKIQNIQPSIENLEENNFTQNQKTANFLMSILFSNFSNKENNFSDYHIAINNIKTNEIENFWPINLPEQEIRKWVSEHINQGFIKEGYVNFKIEEKNNISQILQLDSALNFENLNLNYDNYFPVISDIHGIAKFSLQDMNILITKGLVLNSKILPSQISIKDFNSPTLEIDVKTHGNASDSLRHANYKSEIFTKNIEKYLNGEAESEILVKIPLEKEINLKNIFISVNSIAQNIKNEFIDGKAKISTIKNFDSENFDSKIDFTESKISVGLIKKENNINGFLSFILDLSKENQLLFKNIDLEKTEILKTKNPQNKIHKISGNFSFDTNQEKILSINLQNNFEKNNYIFSYDDLKKQILLNGKSFDYVFIYEIAKIFNSSKSSEINKINISSNLNKIILFNNKSIKNFSLILNCKDKICFKGFAKANYEQNKPLINLAINKDIKEKKYILSGNIFDVGYFAEGLKISDIISYGNAKIKIAQDKEELYKGNIEINDEITFYENNLVKKLESNDLFSKVKDKIFSNKKTTFDTVKLDFIYQNKKLEILSLIANNYKIGITAKGYFDTKNNSYEINGMIIPGFLVNNLFGIGKIPLIGGVISGLLTGGEGGGIFGIKYEYKKSPNQKEAEFSTSVLSSFIPVSIRSLFE